MLRAVRTFPARTAVVFHDWIGRLWLRCRVFGRARRHFERVVELGAGHFDVQVRLGRIAHAEGDFLAWRRACRAARDADPDRFARLAHPFPLFDADGRADPDLGRPRREVGLFRSGVAGPIGCAPTADAERAEASSGTAEDLFPAETTDRDDCQRRDDCSDHGERTRFRARGPIRTEEWAGIDLDELGHRLTR